MNKSILFIAKIMVNAGICNFSICIRVYAPNKKLTKLNFIIKRQLKKICLKYVYIQTYNSIFVQYNYSKYLYLSLFSLLLVLSQSFENFSVFY